MVMVTSAEVLVFFTLNDFPTVIVQSRPTVSIFCFFTKVSDTKGELLFPEEASGLGDVSGGGVIEEEEDGSVSTLMVRDCNGTAWGFRCNNCPFVAFRVCMFH